MLQPETWALNCHQPPKTLNLLTLHCQNKPTSSTLVLHLHPFSNVHYTLACLTVSYIHMTHLCAYNIATTPTPHPHLLFTFSSPLSLPWAVVLFSWGCLPHAPSSSATPADAVRLCWGARAGSWWRRWCQTQCWRDGGSQRACPPPAGRDDTGRTINILKNRVMCITGSKENSLTSWELWSMDTDTEQWGGNATREGWVVNPTHGRRLHNTKHDAGRIMQHLTPTCSHAFYYLSALQCFLP